MSRSRRSSFASISIERILVRALSPAFDRCERSDHSAPIDVDLARRLHRSYVAILRRMADVIEVAPSDLHPDCVFVEDTAVVLDDRTAVVTRPGVRSRQGEVDEIEGVLVRSGFNVVRMAPPATLDGGDVLRVGARLFVGLSTRTNEHGARWIGGVAKEMGLDTVVVSVTAGLHLKSCCSLADEGTLLATADCPIDDAMARREGLRRVVVEEPAGANVLALGGGRVLVSAASPRTADQLHKMGLHVQLLDISELHKADAAMTCSSVRIPAPGAWCT